MKKTIDMTEKPFINALIDTTRYAQKASETDDKTLASLLSKATILHCSFTIEALANNLLNFVDLPDSFMKNIDRWNTLEKLSFLAYTTTGKELDDKNTFIKLCKDFFTIRNRYVHPKVSVTKLTRIAPSSFIGREKYSKIKIPKDPSSWDAEHAIKCIKLLVELIDDFLLNHFKMDIKKIKPMFLVPATKENVNGFLLREKDWFDWLETQGCQPVFYKNLLDNISKSIPKKPE